MIKQTMKLKDLSESEAGLNFITKDFNSQNLSTKKEEPEMVPLFFELIIPNS